MTSWKIHNADVLEVLRTLESNSFDALLSDPPAGISFMNRAWDSDKGGRDKWISWLSEVMTEVHRILKPGAYGLVWSLPRTSHWTGMALENAGFRVRDTVLHCFGSGFPKSLSISRAIDDHNGDERPVHGTQIRKNSPSGIVSVGREAVTVERSLTSAAWEAYGSALKPGMEIWWLIQKPLDGTYAENALKWGVGGINVDGARIETAENLNGGTYSSGVPHSSNMSTSDDAPGATAIGRLKNASGRAFVQPKGRWPANLCLSHSASCELVGTRPGKGYAINRFVDGMKPFGDGAGHEYSSSAVTETVEDWECAADCPIRQMNEQSGDRPGMSGGGKHRADYAGGTFGAMDCEASARNDNGGSARFFSNFAHDEDIAERFRPFLYCAKPNKTETEFGCENLPLVESAELVDREEDSAGMNSPRAGAGRTGAARNIHPTKKGVTLTKWLATMILPPERAEPRRCIVPFFGSGGEGLGAMRAGFEEIVGIEMDPTFVTIAEARMKAWSTVADHLDPSDVKAAKVDERQTSLLDLVAKVGS